MHEVTGPTGAVRSFTLRSLALGLFSGLFIAGFAYYNDYGIRQNLFIGNHMPLSVYSAFFLTLVIVNPVLTRWSRVRLFRTAVPATLLFAGLLVTLALNSAIPFFACLTLVAVVSIISKLRGTDPLQPFAAGELIVIISMALVTCSIPTSGLYRALPQMLVMPQHYGKAIPDWEKAEPDRYVTDLNPNIFPRPDDNGIVYDGYVQGLSGVRTEGQKSLSESDFLLWLREGVRSAWHHLKSLPLLNWAGPALVWFPILIACFIFIVSMCRIVHRQWSENEQLSYPIAEFATTLLRNDHHRMFSDVFYSRLFWIAFAAALSLHIINGWNVYDQKMIQIPTSWNLSNIYWAKFQYLHPARWPVVHASYLYYGKLYLTVIAFAYFLPEEISFSMAISVPVLALIAATSFHLGHQITGEEASFLAFGSYLAMAAVICYTGRHYYWGVFRRACSFNAGAEDASTVAACRWFIGSTIAFILLLVNMGLDWPLAIMMVFIIGVLFLVLARASAESGIPFVGTPFYSTSIITSLLGPAAIGPANLYLMKLVHVATMEDNRECLAPYVTNTLRMAGRTEVPTAPLSRAMIIMLSAALFVGGVAFLWVIYSKGAVNDGHMGRNVPNGFAREISRDIQKMKRAGTLQASQNVDGIERITTDLRTTHPRLFTFIAIGVALVALNAVLRLRYVWWPIHPVMFLFWGVWAPSNFIWSFGIGFIIKLLVVRFGGGRVYQNLKPFFIGVIIGDLCGGAFWIVFGLMYSFWTGKQPPAYNVFPV